jgi:hypothetical protein
MSDADWLNKYVKVLSDLGEKFTDSRPTISYGPHTVLKVISVYYYAGMFAKIAKGDSAKARGYDAAVYLDLFAGPGVVSVGSKGDLVAGSPIAATSTPFPFDYSVFVEIDSAKAAALKARVSTYLTPDKFEVINGETGLSCSFIGSPEDLERRSIRFILDQSTAVMVAPIPEWEMRTSAR